MVLLKMNLKGGAREAFFSDHHKYELIWNNRLGFAKVAVQAKVVRSSIINSFFLYSIILFN